MRYFLESTTDVTFLLDLSGSTNVHLVAGSELCLVQETGVKANARTEVGEWVVTDQSAANMKYSLKVSFKTRAGLPALPAAAAAGNGVEQAVGLPPSAR
jgi:hypothetical protein